MLISLLILAIAQTACLLAVLLLLSRRASGASHADDARRAELSDGVLRMQSRVEAMDANLHQSFDRLASGIRGELAQHRTEAGTRSLAEHGAHQASGQHLREEVARSIAQLSTALAAGLDSFRVDNRDAAGTLQNAIVNDLQNIGQRLSTFIGEVHRAQVEARDGLHSRLAALDAANVQHQEKMRATMEARLDTLNAMNSARLEEMRATVDEKLHATLHSRLTESFGQVTDQLNKVHTGLGEMSKLSEGVDGLSRIFTNVKARGGFAEVQLGMLLEQMLAPSQFVRNARVKPHTLESVEFAVRFPGQGGETLLPIDAKFPREAWERLESAYAANDPALLAHAGRSFEAAIRTEGRRICEKYINPPTTTPHAIMFLPTEGLYAEVMRRDALQAEIQSKCHVTIAGPSTLSAILTSFQMGFHMLALQEKGDEVWKVLEGAKTEFGKFGKLMEKVEVEVGKVQRTLGEVGVRTRAINRSLREVADSSASADLPLEFEDFSTIAHQLVASAEDDL